MLGDKEQHKVQVDHEWVGKNYNQYMKGTQNGHAQNTAYPYTHAVDSNAAIYRLKWKSCRLHFILEVCRIFSTHPMNGERRQLTKHPTDIEVPTLL